MRSNLQIGVYRAVGSLRNEKIPCHCEEALWGRRGNLQVQRSNSQCRHVKGKHQNVPLFATFSVTKILPGDCHGPKGPRNDTVVVTWLRRFEQPDKLQFETKLPAGQRRSLRFSQNCLAGNFSSLFFTKKVAKNMIFGLIF